MTDILDDDYLASEESALEQFKLDQWGRQHETRHMLEKYSTLLEAHKTLLEAYKTLKGAKEAKEGDENALKGKPGQKDMKKEATNLIDASDGVSELCLEPEVTSLGITKHVNEGSDCTEYVLVLVDGIGYLFNPIFLNKLDKHEGGRMAARWLHQAVKNYVQEKGIPGYRIDVRFYADCSDLAKLLGLEKEDIRKFGEGLGSVTGHCQFLGRDKVPERISTELSVAYQDPSCTHILFAACHDMAYEDQLEAYAKMGLGSHAITLVHGACFKEEFKELPYQVANFPAVFRWENVSPRVSAKGKRDAKKEPVSGTATSKYGKVSCKYFSMGACKYGKTCHFKHPGSVFENPRPAEQSSNIHRQLPPNAPTSTLPAADIPGFIPLNSAHHRLDPLLTTPSPAVWAAYNALTTPSPSNPKSPKPEKTTPCARYHLYNSCNVPSCSYSHAEMDPAIRPVLEYLVRGRPCDNGGACRVLGCMYGHVCQKAGCKGQKSSKCKLRRAMHGVDLRVASYVPGVERRRGERAEQGDRSNGLTRVDSAVDGVNMRKEKKEEVWNTRAMKTKKEYLDDKSYDGNVVPSKDWIPVPKPDFLLMDLDSE